MSRRVASFGVVQRRAASSGVTRRRALSLYKLPFSTGCGLLEFDRAYSNVIGLVASILV